MEDAGRKITLFLATHVCTLKLTRLLFIFKFSTTGINSIKKEVKIFVLIITVRSRVFSVILLLENYGRFN